jgi:hypothetical protein
MRRLAALRWTFLLLAGTLPASSPLDPERNQLDLELHTYPAADGSLTPYASNGPFCCPITQILSFHESILAVTSSGFWISNDGENWNLINRIPPDMLATTGDTIFLHAPGTDLLEAANVGNYTPSRSPHGDPVTDLTRVDETLFAANGTSAVFAVQEGAKTWKAASEIRPGARVSRIATAQGVLYAAVNGTADIYQSQTQGSSWTPAGHLPPDSGEFRRLVALENKIYAVTANGLFHLEGSANAWQLTVPAPPDAELYGVTDFKGRRFAATDRGLYVLENGSWLLTHLLLNRGPVVQLSVGHGTVFASTGNGLYESDDSGRSWKPSSSPLGRDVAINGVVSVGRRDFAATAKGLFTRDGSAGWTAVPVAGKNLTVPSIALTQTGKIVLMVRPDGATAPDNIVYESRSTEPITFDPLPPLSEGYRNAHLAVAGDEVFVLPSRGALRLSQDRESWLPEESLAGRIIFTVVKRGAHGLAACAPENIFLREVLSSGSWTPAPQAIVGATSAWFDSAHPEIAIAVSGNGLLWSANLLDSSQQSKRWNQDRPLAFGAALSICPIPETDDHPVNFLIGTDHGVYLVVDRLHRPGWFGKLWGQVSQFVEKNSKEPWFWIVSSASSFVFAYLLAVTAVFLLAWKGAGRWIGADWLLTFVTKPMEVSPRLLRWVLFLGYRKRMLSLPELNDASGPYFGLPADLPSGSSALPDADGNTLHGAIADLLSGSNCLLIEGQGGAGKSTVLSRLAVLGITRRLSGVLKDCLPVYVQAATYEGDLVQALTDTLRRDGVPIDRRGDSIRQQLQAGNILVLFDGVSEIEGDKSKALARMVTLAAELEMQNSWFVFCSRPLKRIPNGMPVLRLRPLDLDVVQNLYLSTRKDLDKEQQNQVLRQLNSFGPGSLEPLLLSLAINDSLNNTVAASKADLFERYFRRLLRVQPESSRLAWEGWRSILQMFADWMMLDTGRRGYGLTHRVLVRLMWSSGTSSRLIKRAEAEYGLSFDNELAVLEQLSSVGILRSGIRWQFRHDSFEAYFAASRILSGLEEDDPVDLQIWTGPSEKDFLPVIEFVREMATSELNGAISSAYADLPEAWKHALERGSENPERPPAHSRDASH